MKGILDPNEISELNKNDVAGFKWKHGNQRSTEIHENKLKYNKFRAKFDNGQVFEAVQNFRHLGALINKKKLMSYELK